MPIRIDAVPPYMSGMDVPPSFHFGGLVTYRFRFELRVGQVVGMKFNAFALSGWLYSLHSSSTWFDESELAWASDEQKAGLL